MSREPADLKPDHLPPAVLQPANLQPPRAQTWRTVRVFISSTFRDMQAERDHLVRFVFPKLREELLKRRIHLVDVDLRWGVTSDQDAVGVCKKIIDECRPRFVCILGGRYGSVPKGKDRSITADEVHYAVLDRPDAEEYRYFYFRDPATTALMEESELGEFREPADSEAERMLAKLKQAVVDAGYRPRAYEGTWDKELRRLKDLQRFGEVVYQDLLKSVDDEFPPPTEGEQAAPDEFSEASAAMDAFIQERTERYVLGSRAELLKDMVEFAEGSGVPNVLTVTGEPGSGKSALLAKLCQEYAVKHPKDILIPHFIGAGPGTTDLRRIVRRLCHELTRAAGDDSEVTQEVKELVQQLPDFLAKAAAGRRVVLVIDALDQLDAADNAHSMYWLPRELLDNVRVITSSLPHKALDALKFRKEQVAIRDLRPLTPEDSRAIVTEFLVHYQKRMTDEQINALLSKQDSRMPLYLLAALEELRTLGTYEEITDRIKELPGEAKPLFHWMLTKRLSSDPGFRDADGSLVGLELVRKFASYIGVSRYGMSHAELAELIAPDDPLGNVAALERFLRHHLMYRGDLLNFYHRQFREVVLEEYLSEEQERLAAHHTLADFFKGKADPKGDSTWTGNSPRGLGELPYHQTEARMWAEVRATLTSWDFVEKKVAAGMTFGLIHDYNQARTAAAAGGVILDEDDAFRDWQRFVSGRPRRLAPLREPFLQIAHNWASAGPVATEAERRAVACHSPWFQMVNRPSQQDRPACLKVLEGHVETVNAVAFSPDGRRALSGSDDSALILWDVDTAEPLRTLKGHTSTVNAVAFSPDGQHALSGSNDMTLILWDVSSGELVRTFKDCAWSVNAVAFSPDGRHALSGATYKTLILWDVSSGELVRTFKGHTDSINAQTVSTYSVNTVAFSPDGRYALSGSNEQTLMLWDVSSGKSLRTFKGHTNGVCAVAFSPDGRYILSGSSDQTLVLWDVSSDGPVRTFKGHTSGVRAVAFSPDGRHALSGSADNTLILWDVASGEPLRTFKGHTNGVCAVAFSPDGQHALSGSDDNTLILWDVGSGEPLRTSKDHTSGVRAVALSPDGRHALSGSWAGTLILWDAGSGEHLRTFKGHANWVCAVAFSPDGQHALSGSDDYTLILWDVGSGEPLRTFRGHANWVRAVTFSPDGRHALSGSDDNTLILWDVGSGEHLRTFKGHADWVRAVAFSPDGRHALSGSDDNTLILWDVGSGESLRTFKGHTNEVRAVAFSPDGQHALSGSANNTLILWDVGSGEPLRTFKGHTNEVHAAAFSLDGRHALSGSVDNTPILWDVGGEPLRTLKSHADWVRAVAFSPDGRHALIGSHDKTLTMLDVETGDVVARCKVIADVYIVDWREDRIVIGLRSGEVQFYRVRGLSQRPSAGEPKPPGTADTVSRPPTVAS